LLTTFYAVNVKFVTKITTVFFYRYCGVSIWYSKTVHGVVGVLVILSVAFEMINVVVVAHAQITLGPMYALIRPALLQSTIPLM